jgi:hypothetical protein
MIAGVSMLALAAAACSSSSSSTGSSGSNLSAAWEAAPFGRLLFYLVLSGLMIPFIVPNLASALGCFLYRQFFLRTAPGARRGGLDRRRAGMAHLLPR